ncbi:general stress protein [Jeotgalibaca sp. PTS2502]|jgi:uncharacterized protein YoxC|uniref:DUF948 domain-containing protein n=1 Tax=Jeotgalibaca sp. PTS2502 TaxID=1903686 RepID=UPI0009739153|nr:DUF948 domain-containing protein [Jeotgalibaca sp. PTS2502]APZ48658.1 general stress protein [Jeotgalibaca sp. PTS2502]
MSWGNIAALIAAVAFAVLVFFLVLAIRKATKILDDVSKIAEEANNSITVITKDVDHLAIEVEGLLNKTNTLMDDLNGKISKTDPLFTAIGDIGVTVSDVNQSTRNLASSITSNKSSKTRKKASTMNNLGRTAAAMNRRRKEQKAAKETDISIY